MRLLLTLLLLAPAGLLHGEVFRTLTGSSVEGELAGVYGDIAIIKAKNGSFSVVIDTLDDAALRRIAAFLTVPPPPEPWKKSNSRIAKALAKHLLVLRDNELVTFDPGARPEPEFYLLYFGAKWCGPCRRFSPDLLQAYQKLKQRAPERFEVIFVSDDVDSREQLDYVRHVPMPWPVVRLSSKIRLLDRYRGNGIPCLVVINREGDLLFHSYSGTEYLGAYDPLKKFEGLLQTMGGDLTGPTQHRLDIARHVHSATNGAAAPAPYDATFQRSANPTLPKAKFTVTLSLDARGRVMEAVLPDDLPLIPAQHLRRQLLQWLFVPAVKNGEPVASEVEFTIDNTA